MDAYTFVESIRQETIRILPIVVVPLMFMLIYAVLECLSSRSYAKELNKHKYKRNSLLSTTTLTKVELELKRLKEVNAR